LNIPLPWQKQAQGETAIISWRECSKKSVQQGRSPFDARSVHGVREHGKRARTPLAAFFNIPIRKRSKGEMYHVIYIAKAFEFKEKTRPWVSEADEYQEWAKNPCSPTEKGESPAHGFR